MGERHVGGETIGNSISVPDVWLSLSVYLILFHTFFLPSTIIAPLCFLPLAHLHPSCLVTVAFDKDMLCRGSSSCLYHIFPLTSARIPICMPMHPNSSSFLFFLLPLRAEYGFQSQGPCVSTPLTLREPCLSLSTRVHVCVFPICACELRALCVSVYKSVIFCVVCICHCSVCVCVCSCMSFVLSFSLSSLVAVLH